MQKVKGRKRIVILALAIIFSGVLTNSQAQQHSQAVTADSLYQQGDFSGSARAYQALAQQWRSRSVPDSAHYYQFWEAKSYIQQYEYQPARTLLQAILSSPAGPDSALLSKVYHEIGYTYMGENDLEQATSFSEQSIRVEQSRAKPDTFQLAKYYELKGFMQMQLGDYAAAKQWATTAHRLRQSVLGPMDKELGYSANTLYIILSTLGEWNQAEAMLAQAWEILSHHLPEEHPHIALVANNYSTLLMNLGDPQQAKEYLASAITSNEKGKRYYPLAANYVNLGMLYLNLNESKTAESYYRLAWSIVDTLLDYPDYYRANTLDALGAVYYQQERLSEADAMFQAALQEKEALFERQSAEISQSLFNLGLIAKERKDWLLATQYFTESESIRAEVAGATNPKRADALFEIAEIAWENGKVAEAVDRWRTSLRIYRQSFGLPHHHSLENLLRLVEAFHALHQPDSVRQYLQLAWGSATGQDQRLSSLNTLDTLPISRYSPEVLDLANTHLKLLLDHGDTLSVNERQTGQRILTVVHAWLPTFLSMFNDASLRASITEQVQDFYRQGAVLAHRALGLPGSEQAAWETQLLNCIQASRGATIQAAFKDRQAIQFAGVPDSLVQQAQQLKQQLQFVVAQQQNAGEEEDSPQRAQQQLTILQSWQALQEYLQQQYPHYYQARFDIPAISREEIRQDLTEKNYTVLAYFAMDTALLAVHLHATKLTSTWLGMPVGWQDSLHVYQRLLQQQTNQTHQAQLGYFLYRQLWEPLSLPAQSPIKILADGPLFYFNFETLLTRAPADPAATAAQPWLIKDFCVFYGHTLPGTAAVVSDQGGGILGVAPGFSPSLKTTYLNNLRPGQAPDSLFLKWLRTPWSTSFVQQLSQKGWGVALTEQTATESHFLEEAPQANILHFGTHARLENERPLYSFLALTPEPDAQQDGYLYTYELYNEPLQAKLAVLTACETGLGSYRRGEGVLSLAHAFRYAGCPSVIYSLWSIDDQQSNRIAELFYENLEQRMSVAEALRAAKLAYLEGAEGSLQSPYYWAGLVLTGEDQLMNLSSSLLPPWATGLAWAAGFLGLGFVTIRIMRRRAG